MVKDFIFVMFVGSAVIMLMMMLEHESIPKWFSLFGVVMMLLNFYWGWRDKNDA